MATYCLLAMPASEEHERYERVMVALGEAVDALADWRHATLRLEEIEAERDELRDRVETLEARVAELEAELEAEIEETAEETTP